VKRLLVVEDDTVLASQLAELFADGGFRVDLARTCAEAARVDASAVDLAIVDWRLPDGEGIDLVRIWRRGRPSLPIVMLTARAQVADKLVALELGANDYVTKPFEPLELAARVRRHLRQVEACSALRRGDEAVIECAGIRLAAASRRVWHGGELVALTKLQYQLLKHFLEHPGAAFSRDEILNRVWGLDSYPTTRTVDNHVAQLRQMFGAHLFETLHGVGYRFAGDAAIVEKDVRETRS
jgi:two-component system alkaline phosphatase synthesis response regulator PhoP